MEEQKFIDYPLSTKYRSEWKTWEGVREVVQNALDSESKVNVEFKNETLKINDHGDGFEMKHLLIGETTKDGESTIGKFGEGLKFALLVLLREGCKINIRSNGTTFVPELTKIFDQSCLRINYNSSEEKYPGTEVVIEGVKESYEDKFLSLDHDTNFTNLVLLDGPGRLFVKGIYAHEIKSIASYNLVVERENPISGSVDRDSIRDVLKDLIKNTDNVGYIEELLETVLRDPQNKGMYLEYGAGSWITWKMKHPELWKKAVDRILGSKACLFTARATATEAVHQGFTPVECNAYFLKGVLKTDAEVIRESNSGSTTIFDLKKLSFSDRENVREVLWLIQRSLDLNSNFIKVFRIVIFEDEETLGRSAFEHKLDLSYKVLSNFKDLLMAMLHELVHFTMGYNDLTDAFTEHLPYLNADVICHLRFHMYQLPPKDFLKGTSLEYKPEEGESSKE